MRRGLAFVVTFALLTGLGLAVAVVALTDTDPVDFLFLPAVLIVAVAIIQSQQDPILAFLPSKKAPLPRRLVPD